MQNINVLLAGTDRRLNNLIEATLLDLCFGQAVLTFVRVARVDDFVWQASWDGFGLIIVAADDLMPRKNHPGTNIPLREAVAAITQIRSRHFTPMIAVRVAAAHQSELQQAGVDQVLGIPLDRELLREHARQMLRLSAPPTEVLSVHRFAWFTNFVRGFQRQAQNG